MRVKSHIPNILTTLNLLSGCISIALALQGNPAIAAVILGASLCFDFLDGFAARWLGVSGELGKQLDSLADVVSFGVAPSAILYTMLMPYSDGTLMKWPAILAFLVAAAAAWRLAKFNIDARQSSGFLGLPTPASAIFIASLPLIAEQFNNDTSLSPLIVWIAHPYFLLLVTVVLSLLMVSEIKLFALKFKRFDWKSNQLIYSFLICSAALLLVLKFAALPLIVIVYIVLSLIRNWTSNEIQSRN